LQDPAGGFLQVRCHPVAAVLQGLLLRLLLLLLGCQMPSAAARQQ
jgi:hypothetical protein